MAPLVKSKMTPLYKLGSNQTRLEIEKNENQEDWKKNKRAGVFAKRVQELEIDQDKSFEWLKRGVLKFDNEKIILAAQDNGLLTNGLKKPFKCNMCDYTSKCTH